MLAEPGLKPEMTLLHSTEGQHAFARVALLTAGALVLFAPTALSMVEIWRRSDTFAHGFIIVPAFLYFVWIRRSALAATPAAPFWPGVFVIAAAGLVWLLAQLAGVVVLAQFAVVSMVPAAILTVLGPASLRVLLFPCAFLFFAVPFGEAFVPTLIQWTADFTVAALRLSGVPVYREGMSFVVPSGQWSVVEACSGIRYLIATAMSGVLYAWLMYRSPRRRALFIIASLLVPLVANWVRAYGIVMIGHLSNNRLATGVDHLLYGWVFFGLVIAALFATGARWREDLADDPLPMPTNRVGVARPQRGGKLAFALAAAAMIMWPLIHTVLGRASALPPVPALEARLARGWEQTAAFTQWRAGTRRPARQELWFFRKGSDIVGVQVALYRDQGEDAKLVSSANQLIDAAHELTWRVTSQRRVSSPNASTNQAYRETLLMADRPLAVRDWYWLGDEVTTSDLHATARIALTRLLRRDDTAAWVLLFTPMEDPSAGPQVALDRLDAFQREMGSSIEQALQGARR